ncbi:MAG: virulence RhuM family protein [Marinilabiliaceae bacterium]|nr:virulence RhuM family protein [Marinilabiliaceae bacterium]
MNAENIVATALPQPINKGEIVLYHPDNSLTLEVRLEDETVWLSQSQMAELFQTTRNNVSIHISNIFREGELEQFMVCKKSLHTTQHGAIVGKTQKTPLNLYNLDVIISVGYRIKSKRGTLFRIWANSVIKDYLLRGYVFHQRIEHVEKLAIATENRVSETEKRLSDAENKIDFYVKTDQPKKEGIFFDEQIFDAYIFVSDLIKSAKKTIILIDNYVDETVLLLLSKRETGVSATIYTAQISPQLMLDLQKHNAQYPTITIDLFTRSHDRFLFIDNTVYHFGASLKDLGKKWFAFSKMGLDANALLQIMI